MQKKLAIVTLFILALAKMQLVGQEQASFADSGLYESVLNEVFRADIGDFSNHNKLYEILLRFMPAERTEIQIAIIKESQSFSYVVWLVPPTQPTIWDQVAAISTRLKTRDPKIISQEIRVERRVLEKPSPELQRLVQSFPRLRFSPAFNQSLVLDGSRYELWFDSLSNSTHFSLEGSHSGKSSDHPLIVWMIGVRSEVGKVLGNKGF